PAERLDELWEARLAVVQERHCSSSRLRALATLSSASRRTGTACRNSSVASPRAAVWASTASARRVRSLGQAASARVSLLCTCAVAIPTPPSGPEGHLLRDAPGRRLTQRILVFLVSVNGAHGAELAGEEQLGAGDLHGVLTVDAVADQVEDLRRGPDAAAA